MILLCGKTCCGKTVIRSELVEKGLKPIVTYTTRPMREGEIEDVTYHYISTEEFLQKESEGFFIETTSYKVASGGTWYYGTAKEDITPNSVLIVNPDGLKVFKSIEGIKTTAFLIMADEDTLWNRLRQRGDNAEEARRRLNSDEKDFKHVADYVDFAIRNVNEDLDKITTMIIYLTCFSDEDFEYWETMKMEDEV